LSESIEINQHGENWRRTFGTPLSAQFKEKMSELTARGGIDPLRVFRLDKLLARTVRD
jgi:hypothetical protein